MMSINATRKIFQMISIAAFLPLCFYMTIDYYYYLTVLDKKYAKIFHEELLLLLRRKKTKIIHENDAIQSEKSSNAIHTENYTKSRMI